MAPTLQRRPDAATKTEAIDGARRSQRLETVQFDAAPLESAFLQNVAGGRVGDPRTGTDEGDIEFLEREIDHRARGFGGKTSSPMVDPQPIAELGCVRLAPIRADHPDRRAIVFDQKYAFARLARHPAHKIN